MNHVLVLGRRGRMPGLFVVLAAIDAARKELEQLHDVVSGDVVIPISCADLGELAEKLNQAKNQKQPSCFFVMPKPQRINEHPNDDWRGRGNRKKRIKRNDR